METRYRDKLVNQIIIIIMIINIIELGKNKVLIIVQNWLKKCSI